MGKLSEIPRLRAVMAERTQRLRDEKAGVSDAAAARMGLVTPDEFNKRVPRNENEVFRDLVEMVVVHHSVQRSTPDELDARMGDWPTPDEKSIIRRCPWAARSAIIPTPVGLFCVVAYADTIESPDTERMRDAVREILLEGYSHLIPMHTSPDVRITDTGNFDTMVARARAGGLAHLDTMKRPPSMSNGVPLVPVQPSAEALIDDIHNDIDGLLAENERLTRQVAELQADIRRRTTPYNPASRREEPWDPIATLEDISAQVPRDRRFEGYTLVGAVQEMAKALAEAEKRPTSAEIDAALADVLLKQAKLEPGMLVALRAGEDTDPKIMRRMAVALNKALTDRYGSMTYGSPTVLVLPPDASMETMPTNGRGPVQVNVHPEGHPKKPTDVPKHVARAYAEAAAASYGVTPEVVQAKRRTRGLRRAIARRVDARIDAPDSPFITPEIRNEHRTIGRDIIAYDDPADLMCADAPDAEG